jgi:hypothetical protein
MQDGPLFAKVQRLGDGSGRQLVNAFSRWSATTSDTALATTTTTPARSIPPPHSSSGGVLPFTGAPVAQLALIAVALAAIGAFLVVSTRRRQTARQ